MKATITSVGDHELRLGEINRRLPENLIGAAKLTILTFELLQACTLISGKAGSAALIALSAANPFAQGLRCAADLLGDGADGRPLRGIMVLMLEHHADGPFSDLGGVLLRLVHDSKFSRVGVSGKPGAVQCHTN